MSRWVRRTALAIAGLAALSGALYGGAWLVTAHRISDVFANTTAAQMCAGLFISGRTQEAVFEQSFQKKPPRDRIYADLAIDVDRVAGRVTVDGSLIEPVTAVYAGRRGCVLLPDGEAGDGLAQKPPALPPASDHSDASAIRWATRKVLAEDIDAAKLDAAIEANFADPSHYTHSFLVYHRGALIREAYRGHAGPTVSSESWSLGKTLIGALAGRLILEGALSLDEPIAISHWPDAADPRRAIRVRDLLNMASGLDFSTEAEFFPVFNQSDHGLIYTNLRDIVAFSADRPLTRSPGEQGNYNNADVLLLMEHIRQKLGLSHEDLVALIRRKVLAPLGMMSVRLSTDFAGNPVITGYVYGSARDWGKLALAYAGRGESDGYRLFSEDFFAFIRQPSPNYPEEAYGGMIWLNRHGYYGAPRDALVMSGAGDQVAVILPDAGIVIVRMGHLNKSDTMPFVFNDSLQKIIAALTP